MSRKFKLSSFTPSLGGSWRSVLSMMREEKLFSTIHIVGTAMAIAFTMVMAVVYYIKLAPIYPEVNRMRTVYFDGLYLKTEKHGLHTYYGIKAFKEWFQDSPNIEFCAPTLLAAGTGKFDKSTCHDWVVKDKDEYIDVIKNMTTADFFKIYEYDFLQGRPFTRKEVEANEHVAVISDALAEKLFGKNTDAVGRIVKMDDSMIKEVRVVGVVRGASQLTPDSYADIIMPCTLGFNDDYTGMYSIIVTVKDNEHMQALKRELDDVSARALQTHPEILDRRDFKEVEKPKMLLTENMETHPMYVLRTENGNSWFSLASIWQIIKHYAGILFVLLFVPALNLCGIIAGRMERRTTEMAVRKTFGARRSTLLHQVVWENLVLTSIGGVVGLALSWLAIYGWRTEIMGLFFDNSILTSTPIVSGEMLFAPTLFLSAFVAVVVLNLLAAVVPAWWSLRKPIVESMMEKR